MTSTFHKGDRVETEDGDGTIVADDSYGTYKVELDSGDVYEYDDDELLSLEVKTTRSFNKVGVAKKVSTMDRLSILAKKAINPNLRNMIKVGWLDNGLQLTSRGEEVVLADYLAENEDKFGKLAEEQLKEEKKDKDCK